MATSRPSPARRSSGSKRVSNRLVALGSAGVMTVYAVGFFRTQAAAGRLEAMSDRPRVVIPDGPEAGGPGLGKASEPAGLEAPAIQVVATIPAKPTTNQPPPEIATEAKGPEAPARSEPTPASPAQPEAAAITTDLPVEVPAPKPSQPAEPTVTVPVQASEPAAEAQAPAAPPPANPTPDPPAPASVAVEPITEPTTSTEPAPAAQWKDGTYLGWGTSRHGNIQAQVTIESGRIVSASIAQCRTRYSCSRIARLPPQVVERQSPETDFVSGATQSTNAFYYGVVEALSKAR